MRREARPLIAVIALLAVPACHGKGAPASPVAATAAAFTPEIDSALCDPDGKEVVTHDLDRDGNPDVWVLFRKASGATGRSMTCREVDFDHDGRKDWAVGYAADGARLFEEEDLDYDGRWDVVAVYAPGTGTLAKVFHGTGFDGRFEIEETYDGQGALASVHEAPATAPGGK